LLATVLAAPLLRAEIVMQGTGVSPAAVEVSWSDTAPDRGGYAVMAGDTPTGSSWRFAGGPDLWPSGPVTTVVAATQSVGLVRVQAVPRGKLVSGTLQSSSSVLLLAFLFTQYGIPWAPTYPVQVHRITYTTFDHRNQSTLASGAVIVPVGPTAGPLVSYQHGTIFRRTDAPSNPAAADQAVGVALATDGYFVVLPDYLGLGTNSPSLHPYLHARSEAVAAVDLLRAARTYLSNNLARQTDGHLFLAGYSQGGHATLALQRELEERHAGEFPLTASAAMAGPHDLSGRMRTLMLSGAPYGNPEYVPYLFLGLNAVYGLVATPADALQAPYATTLPPLFDGAHSAAEIQAAMPAVPTDIFRTDFLAAFGADSNHPFRVALAANDTFRWTPVAPLRLYHCAGDTVVPQANSWIAYSNFLARGAPQVSFVDPSPASDHSAGALPSFLAAKAWFDSLRGP
jgi:hypothetical protein